MGRRVGSDAGVARRRGQKTELQDSARAQRLFLECTTVGWLAAGISILIPAAAASGPLLLGYGLTSLIGLAGPVIIVWWSSDPGSRCRPAMRLLAAIHALLVPVLLALIVPPLQDNLCQLGRGGGPERPLPS